MWMYTTIIAVIDDVPWAWIWVHKIRWILLGFAPGLKLSHPDLLNQSSYLIEILDLCFVYMYSSTIYTVGLFFFLLN